MSTQIERLLTELQGAVIAIGETQAQHSALLQGLNADRTDMLARFIVSVALFDSIVATFPEHAEAISERVLARVSSGPQSLAPKLRERMQDIARQVITGLPDRNGNSGATTWN